MPTDKGEDELPSTLERSDEHAQQIWAKTHDSAVETYGEGERAHRTAYASLKHSYEKVGDHWEAKQEKGPSDQQAEKTTPESAEGGQTAGGVDANANKGHLLRVAAKVGVEGAGDLRKDELVHEIDKANKRETAKARRREQDS